MSRHRLFPLQDARLGLMLILWTSCCILLVVFRIWRTSSYLYLSLLWNLALAWVPMIAAWLIFWTERRNFASPVGRGLIFLTWFFFFPNAPYIVTDLIHLTPRFGIPVWYDLMVIVYCACTGLVLAFGSLHLMQQVFSSRFGNWSGWLLVGLTIPAASFAIYLGRFLEWNSWDIVLNPWSLIANILSIWRNPLADPAPIGISILLSLFLTLTYGTLSIAVGLKTTAGIEASSMS